MLKQFFFSLILLLTLSACQVIVSSEGTQPTPVEVVSTQPVPTTPPAVDAGPAQLAAVFALAQELQIPADQVQWVSTTPVEWNDGCLEVVIPGAMCSQGIVPGFRVMLSAYGSSYEYHTNQDGSYVLRVPPSAVRVAVRMLDGSMQIVPIPYTDTQLELTPAVHGLMPLGGTARGTVYALIYGDTPKVTATDANGTRLLDFIQKPNYGLAVWPGDMTNGPLLAWGTHVNFDTMVAELFVSAPDGSGLITLISEKVEAMPPYAFVAQRFSADGKSLYFSKEPYGIGGYILFGGASSLYRIDLVSKQVTEIIPLDLQAAQSPFICLDAFSPDYAQVTDHCSPYEIKVKNLESGQAVTILPPAVVKDRSILGSARFSPDGSRVAFAGAKGDPDAEQGWLAVSDELTGTSTLVITSEPDTYFTVLGWLTTHTILVESNTRQCDSPECLGSIWAVAADGSSQVKVAEGKFVSFVDGYQP